MSCPFFYPLGNGIGGGECDHFLAYLFDEGLVAGVHDDARDQVGNLLHFGFLHAAGGDGGRSDANAGGHEGTFGVEGNGVFIDGDGGAVECGGGVFAGGSGGG